MENLTHTLLGLALAKSGLERATPLATATLVISSNLPDIDAVTRLASSAISYLEYHRGFTHSFAGLAVLSALLTLIILYFDRRFRLRRDPFQRPVRGARIFAISYLGGLGHLFMDFTNSYGVILAVYYSGMWMAYSSALEQARRSSPIEAARSTSAWPMPANPLFWQSMIAGDNLVYTRYINLAGSTSEWHEESALEERFVEALRKSEEARIFLDFMRYGAATVEEREDGYLVALRDLRFPLQMKVVLDRELAVRSVSARWY
jgi:hypothetical protein